MGKRIRIDCECGAVHRVSMKDGSPQVQTTKVKKRDPNDLLAIFDTSKPGEETIEGTAAVEGDDDDGEDN